MALFNILVDIAARTASLESGVNTAIKSLERLSAAAEVVKSTLETAFIGFSVVSLVEGLTRTVEGIEEIGRAAQKANVTVEAFSALSYAAKQVGVSTEALGKGFKFMERAIADATDKSGPAHQALEDIGVDLTKLKALSPDKQFEVIAEAISRMHEPTKKVRAELALFGKAGNELAPLFDEGAAGIERMIAKAKEMGIVLDTESTKKATEAAESIKSMNAAWTALFRTIAEKSAPAMKAVADFLRVSMGGGTTDEQIEHTKDKISELQHLIANVGDGGGAVPKSMTDRLAEYIAKLNALKDASKKAADETAANIAKINDALKPPGKDWLEEALQYVKDLKPHLDSQKISTKGIDDYYVHLTDLYQDETQKKLEEWAKQKVGLHELLSQGLITQKAADESMSEFLDKIIGDVQVKGTMIRKQVKDTLDFSDEMMKSAAHSIQQSFADFLFDPFAKGVGGMVTGFITAIRRMVAELAANTILKQLFGFGAGAGGANTGFAGSLQSLITGLVGGGGSTNSGPVPADTGLDVPFMAKGGPITGPVVVGDGGGPELFTPGGSGSITPAGQFGGARITTHFAPVYHVDSRSDRAQLLHDMALLTKQAVSDHTRSLLDAMSRNGYPAIHY